MKKVFCTFLFPFCVVAAAQASGFEVEMRTIRNLAGCYFVDYSYVEIESLQEGYDLDPRVYDATESRSVKELILPIEKSPSEIRLQHVLFTTDESGNPTFFLKHHGEDWQYEPSHLFEYQAPGNWVARMPNDASGKWLRKITNLDDGPRHQCLAGWNWEAEYPEWRCESAAPIPGRETRDMGRTDYQTLWRDSRVISYQGNWLERQLNTKIIQANETKEALAREKGKNWYVRLPEEECASARSWAEERLDFWGLLAEVWDEFYQSRAAIQETVGDSSRYAAISGIEEQFLNSTDPHREEIARLAIREAIQNSLPTERSSASVE